MHYGETGQMSHDMYRAQPSDSYGGPSHSRLFSTAVRKQDHPVYPFAVRLVFTRPCGDPSMASYHYTAWLVGSQVEAGCLTSLAYKRADDIAKAWLTGDERSLDQIIQEIEDENNPT